MVKNWWTIGRFGADWRLQAAKSPPWRPCPYDCESPWSRTPLPIADYARCLLAIAETVHCWLSALAALDEKRRARVAGYAEKIAATLQRAGEALRLLEAAHWRPRGARKSRARAGPHQRLYRDDGRAPWSITLTGASSRGLKGA